MREYGPPVQTGARGENSDRRRGQMHAMKQDALPFAKMAGGGNDFVVIDNREAVVADPVELTRRICTPHLSVGADGLILIEASERANFRMRYYNADGSRGEFCANGTRCAARFAVLLGTAPMRMTIETDAGIVGAEVVREGGVKISLPPPQAFRAERTLRVGEQLIRGSSVTVGVPHYVIFLKDDLWTQDIVPLGRAIRRHLDLQPEGANVNFVVVRDGHSIEVRTYERGVEAETLSCGSGVVASVAASALFDRVTSPVSVLTRSGITLEVSFVREGDELREFFLRGDARLIYRAATTADTIEGFDADWPRKSVDKVVIAGS
jgi:diaminopimelate epimerase